MLSISSYLAAWKTMADGMRIEVHSMDLAVTAEVIACQGFAAVCVHPVCVEAVLCRASFVFDMNNLTKRVANMELMIVTRFYMSK